MSDDEPPQPPPRDVPLVVWAALGLIVVLVFILAVGRLRPA